MGTITIVGLGPGNGRLLTRSAWETLQQADAVYLRTARHPAVADLPDTIELHSFDALYESAAQFGDVYRQIVAALLRLAATDDVVYAVPGHPFVGEATVTALVAAAAEQGVAVQVEPGLSFVEPMLTAVQVDGLDGLQIFDALELITNHVPPITPDVPVLIGQVYNRLVASELKMTLMALYPDEHEVVLVHGAGSDDELIERLPLYAIDRSETAAHLTSLYVPALPYPASLTALAETVAILRSPDGCPWDQEQTPQSMRSGFVEEASEVLEALDLEDNDGLREELGDMFYHLIMQIQMATEAAEFRLSDVLAGIDAKLKRRHPHVWGDWQVADSAEVVQNWEMIKAQENGTPAASTQSVLDDIPQTLPALARSQKIQERARQAGFDWPTIDGVYDKLAEEINELKTAVTLQEKADELGDLLYVAVNLGKWLGIDAESALRDANLKFTRRFHIVERLARETGQDLNALSLDELEALWQLAKKQLAS